MQVTYLSGVVWVVLLLMVATKGLFCGLAKHNFSPALPLGCALGWCAYISTKTLVTD